MAHQESLGEVKEEEITDATFARLKNTLLTPDQLDKLFAHRPANARDEYLSLIAGVIW